MHKRFKKNWEHNLISNKDKEIIKGFVITIDVEKYDSNTINRALLLIGVYNLNKVAFSPFRTKILYVCLVLSLKKNFKF